MGEVYFGKKLNMESNKSLKLQSCYNLSFSGNGELLVTLPRNIVVWDVAARTKRFRVHPLSNPSHCDVDPSGEIMALKNTSGQIALINANDGSFILMLDSSKNNEGFNILYSPCGQYLSRWILGWGLTVRSAITGNAEFQKVFPHEMIAHVIRTRDNTWFIVHQPKTNAYDKPPDRAYVSVWSWQFTSPIDFLWNKLLLHQGDVNVLMA